MKRTWFAVFLSLILLFGTFSSVSAGKPQELNPTLQIHSTSSYFNNLLSYELTDSKKTPDKYIVKHEGEVLYEGVNKNFNHVNLQPGAAYNYTVEAYFRDKLLAADSYTASTVKIVVGSIEVQADVQEDQSVLVTWQDGRTDLIPDEYRVYVNEVLQPQSSSLQQVTISNLKPGQHTITVEGFHNNNLVSKGNQSVTIEEPVPVSPIELQYTLNPDFSADVSFQLLNPALLPENYIVYLNGEVIYTGMPEENRITISELPPGGTSIVKVEAYNENDLVGEGTTSIKTPYKINTFYDFDWVPEQAFITFSYDKAIQNADRMVILRKDQFYVNGYLQETKDFVTVYDGLPINSWMEGFTPEVTRHNYTILNYSDGELVGMGYASVPNIFNY